jgi:hypothetical protein
MFKRISLGFGLVLVILLGVIATRPSHFTVERSITIATAPAAPYALVSDFHRWNEWSPWDKRDPAMIKTYTGPAAGEGASYGWRGNSDVGEGNMTILEAVPPSHLGLRLEFFKPFAGISTTAFDFKPTNAGTIVTWRMDGTNGFMGKAVSLFISMDKMIGTDFEHGLASIKTLAEAEGKRTTK